MEIFGREKQIKFLENVFQQEITEQKKNKGSNCVLPSSVFIWGCSNTGKTFVLEKCLEKVCIQYKIIRVNCIEVICGERAVIFTLVQQLANSFGINIDESSCDTIELFLTEFKPYLLEKYHKENDGIGIIIIVDQSEILTRTHHELFQFFYSLRKYLTINICTIFISLIPWKGYSHFTTGSPPPTIYFPQYTTEELELIISNEKHRGFNRQQYKIYVRTILQFFGVKCRDVVTLKAILFKYRSIVKQTFQQSLTNKEDSEMKRLLKILKPSLLLDLENMYLSDIFDDKMLVKQIKLNETEEKSIFQDQIEQEEMNDIPECGNWILISAYIASVNPTASDKRFFAKERTTSTKRNHSTKENPEASTVNSVKETSSKPRVSQSISHERLVGIFTVLTDCKFAIDVNFYTSIADLCGCGLMDKIGNELNDVRYRLNTTEDFIRNCSKSVQFDLDPYLYRLL